MMTLMMLMMQSDSDSDMKLDGTVHHLFSEEHYSPAESSSTGLSSVSDGRMSNPNLRYVILYPMTKIEVPIPSLW